MGSTVYDPDRYSQAQANLRAKGVDPMAFSAKAAASGGVVGMSPLLDVSDRHGRYFESCDLEDGTQVQPLTIMLDGSGSGIEQVRIVQETIPDLFGLLTLEGYVSHPQAQIMAFGDIGENYVVQASEFEGGDKFDEIIRATILEGFGGGNRREAGSLCGWIATNMNKLDCWQRNEKGHLFCVTDEAWYDVTRAEWINEYIKPREKVSTDVGLDTLLAEINDKYHFYVIMCNSSQYSHDSRMNEWWVDHTLPEHFIKIPAQDINKTVAGIMGAHYGVPMTKIAQDLKGTTALSVVEKIAAADKSLARKNAPKSNSIKRF